jgi:hypothetical protein
MKAAISLLFLSVGMCAYADQMQFDPAYLNDGIYNEEAVVASAISDGIYEGQIDDPAVMLVGAPAGMGSCTRHTEVGVPCYCNGRILSRKNPPGWTYVRHLTWIRPGWHVTNSKGEHAGGDTCYKDRDATPEERERFRRTGL